MEVGQVKKNRKVRHRRSHNDRSTSNTVDTVSMACTAIVTTAVLAYGTYRLVSWAWNRNDEGTVSPVDGTNENEKDSVNDNTKDECNENEHNHSSSIEYTTNKDKQSNDHKEKNAQMSASTATSINFVPHATKTFVRDTFKGYEWMTSISYVSSIFSSTSNSFFGRGPEQSIYPPIQTNNYYDYGYCQQKDIPDELPITHDSSYFNRQRKNEQQELDIINDNMDFDLQQQDIDSLRQHLLKHRQRRFVQCRLDVKRTLERFLPIIKQRVLTESDTVTLSKCTSQLKKIRKAEKQQHLNEPNNTVEGKKEIDTTDLSSPCDSSIGNQTVHEMEKEKGRLWKEIQIITFTRVFASTYTIALVYVTLTIQLNLIAGQFLIRDEQEQLKRLKLQKQRESYFQRKEEEEKSHLNQNNVDCEANEDDNNDENFGTTIDHNKKKIYLKNTTEFDHKDECHECSHEFHDFPQYDRRSCAENNNESSDSDQSANTFKKSLEHLLGYTFDTILLKNVIPLIGTCVRQAMVDIFFNDGKYIENNSLWNVLSPLSMKITMMQLLDKMKQINHHVSHKIKHHIPVVPSPHEHQSPQNSYLEEEQIRNTNSATTKDNNDTNSYLEVASSLLHLLVSTAASKLQCDCDDNNSLANEIQVSHGQADDAPPSTPLTQENTFSENSITNTITDSRSQKEMCTNETSITANSITMYHFQETLDLLESPLTRDAVMDCIRTVFERIVLLLPTSTLSHRINDKNMDTKSTMPLVSILTQWKQIYPKLLCNTSVPDTRTTTLESTEWNIEDCFSIFESTQSVIDLAQACFQ